MSHAGKRYIDVVGELRAARSECEVRGETLDQMVELEFVEELDELWRQLSAEERSDIERKMASSTPGALPVLGFIDAEAGSGRVPRRAAA